MPRIAVESNNWIQLRIRPEGKALLLRAVALNPTTPDGKPSLPVNK
jgi:hypothetical protein